MDRVRAAWQNTGRHAAAAAIILFGAPPAPQGCARAVGHRMKGHRRTFMTHAVVLSIFFTMGATLAMPVGQEDVTQAEQVVRGLSAQEVEAFLHRDPRRLADLWSDDFVVTNPLNRIAKKKDVLAMIDSGFLVITGYERRIEYVRAEKDLVILVGSETVTWGGRMPGAGTPQELRFTAIWRKLPGGWQQIARHANVTNS